MCSPSPGSPARASPFAAATFEGGSARADRYRVQERQRGHGRRRAYEDAAELAGLVAEVIGSAAADILVGSTGVIGRPYPMERIRRHFEGLQMPGQQPISRPWPEPS